MINLAGKTAVVFGLANKRSIAWGIAQKLHEAGATLAICYQNERMKLEARLSSTSCPAPAASSATSPATSRLIPLRRLKEKYGKLEILVHAVAFAPAAESARRFPQYQPRRLPHRPRRQRLLADRRHPRRRAADDRWRQHYHP